MKLTRPFLAAAALLVLAAAAPANGYRSRAVVFTQSHYHTTAFLTSYSYTPVSFAYLPAAVAYYQPAAAYQAPAVQLQAPPCPQAAPQVQALPLPQAVPCPQAAPYAAQSPAFATYFQAQYGQAFTAVAFRQVYGVPLSVVTFRQVHTSWVGAGRPVLRVTAAVARGIGRAAAAPFHRPAASVQQTTVIRQRTVTKSR